jgi:hypothetical protein
MIPNNILVLQQTNVIPRSTSMKAVVQANTAPKTGLTFENRNDFNSRNIMGVVLRVNNDNNDTKTGKDGGKLITKEWAENAFLSFQKGTNAIYDQIPLSSLIPAAGENYVKLWIPDFDPSSSKFTFSAGLLDAVNPRTIELIFVHSEL